MAVQRVLGATWATIHGPGDSDRMVRWLLDSKFEGLVPGPAARSVDWPDLVRAAQNVPLTFPAVRTSPVLAQGVIPGLASTQTAEISKARQAVQRAVAISNVVGTDLIVLDVGVVPMMGEVEREDLGESGWTEHTVQALQARRKAGLNAALDRVCRSVFDLCQAFPDKWFCLTPGRSLRSVLDLQGLGLVFEDLSGQRLRYWHDTAIAARREQLLGEAQGEWLDLFSNRLAGCTLGDATEDGLYLPPGSGGVDYPLLGAYLPRAGKGVVACLELDPAVQAGELPGVRSCLDKFGL